MRSRSLAEKLCNAPLRLCLPLTSQQFGSSLPSDDFQLRRGTEEASYSPSEILNGNIFRDAAQTDRISGPITSFPCLLNLTTVA